MTDPPRTVPYPAPSPYAAPSPYSSSRRKAGPR